MVSVVIASRGRLEDVVACIESIQRSSPMPVGGIEVCVVAILYSDRELEVIKSSGALVISIDRPMFASEAHNIGAGSTVGTCLLFIDDDNVVAEDAVWQLARSLRDWPEAVMVGPVAYYAAQPTRIWCAGVQRTTILSRTKMRTRLPHPVPERLASDDLPNCFMVRRADFERVGGFDAHRFPQHMAEGDLACRLASDRGVVYCVPRARVWHAIGTSFLRRLHMQNQDLAYLVARDRAVFTAVYGTRLQWFVYILFGQWALFIVSMIALVFRRPPRWRRVAAAYVGGMLAGAKRGFLADQRPSYPQG
jgi:GT2 family glycosyltransferase